jgi:uncharacterized protein YfaP (DUF2135 family)
LTPEQLAAGELRQDLITNKTIASLAFIHTLGELTNVPADQVNDPTETQQYKASIAILFTIGEDSVTVENIQSFLENVMQTNDPIGEILKLRYGGNGTVPEEGGILIAGDVKFFIPTDAILRDINISVSETALPAPLPEGLSLTGNVIDINIAQEDQDVMNAPFRVTVRYDDSNLTDEETLLALHYNEESGQYEPVTMLAQDVTSNTILFDSRTFSPIVIVKVDSALLESFDSGFRASAHGWGIDNFGSYFSPGGNGFGMSGYAVWYYTHNNDSLREKFSENISDLVATRTQLAQNQTWGLTEWRREQRLTQSHIAFLMKAYMSLLHRPLVLLAGVDRDSKHAMVLYRFDGSNFYFYDVDLVQNEQSVRFDGTSFSAYGSYNSFGYAALASFGRSSDFGYLTQEAENGFSSSEDIILNSPSEGESIQSHSTRLSGSLVNSLSGTQTLYATVKGFSREIPLDGSNNFSQEIEISEGDNTIVLIAGADLQTESNWIRNGAVLVRDVVGNFAVTKLLVTLTWDQNYADVDLYITDPNGETMWYANGETSSGVTLDVDDTDGYGPEHGTLTTESASTGVVLDGNYIVRVHYYDDHGAGPATGHVNIVVNEGTEQQVTKTIPFKLNTYDYGNDAPGSIGSDWADIAVVDVVHGIIH